MTFYGVIQPEPPNTTIKMDQDDDALIYRLSYPARPVSHVSVQIQSTDGTAWPTSAVLKIKISSDRLNWYDPTTTGTWSAYGYGSANVYEVRGPLFMRIYVDTVGSSTVYARPIVTAFDADI